MASTRALALAGSIAALGFALSVAVESTAAAAPRCGGAHIQKSTGGSWRCTFADEFKGTSLNENKWLPQRTDTSGYKSGLTACFVASPNNISVSNGRLRL